MKLKVDNTGHDYCRLSEVRYYYETEGKQDDLGRWFTPKDGFKVGRGGHHVWLADRYGQRLMMVSEAE